MGRIQALGALFFAVISLSAHAYTPTITPNGIPVRWKGAPHIDLAGNPANQSGMSADAFFTAVTRSLNRWKSASGGAVDFGYWQGTDPGVYVPGSNYDGLSSIYFASNGKQNGSLSSNVLGLTQVWYDTSNGQILETDIVLNDRDFRFTSNPRDTSGYGSGNPSYSGGKSNVFIENVITHELGHAYGLSHSGGLQSTMLFMESPEQAHLGCDDSTAIHALYPSGDAGARGGMNGYVVSESGAPVFGAHVVAISRRRGTAIATAMTDKSGHYYFGALEPGTYFLMAEPFYAGPSSLPGYYSNLQYSICSGGRSFSRSPLVDETGFRLRPIDVQAGASSGVQNIVASCSYSGGAAVSANTGASSPSTAPVVYSGSGPGGFGISDRFGYNQAGFYKIAALSENLEVHALSYSLYSPMRPSLSLYDASGNSVNAQIINSVYRGDSGYVNFDSKLTVSGLPAGDYYVRVSPTATDSNLYPAGPVSLDTVPFFFLTGSVNEGSFTPGVDLPDNARCRMDETFPEYVSPPGNPPRHSTDGQDGVGFCGTVQRIGGSPRGGQGPGAAAAIGWLLPFVVSGLIARRLRRI